MDVELFKPFKLILITLKVTGMWQDSNQSWIYFIAGHSFRFLVVEYTFAIILCTTFNEQNKQEVTKSVFFLAVLLILTMKCWNFLFKIKRIQECFQSLLDLLDFTADERFKSRNHVKRRVKNSFKLYKALWFRVYSNTFTGFVVGIAIHELPVKAWFPFYTEYNKIGFWIALLYWTIVPLAIGAIGVTLDMLPLIFMTFATGIIDEFCERLSQIGELQESVDDELIKCIEIHKNIKKFIGDVSANFSAAVIVQNFGHSIVVCANSYTVSKVSLFIQWIAKQFLSTPIVIKQLRTLK
jgi:hypothetical protein